jgi:tRNA (cmo5U34)-methyltransferase
MKISRFGMVPPCFWRFSDEQMSSDNLYLHGRVTEDFTFNNQVAEVFDDMLARSVPFYREVITATAELIGKTVAPGSRIYDLGCSTGSTLLELARLLPDKNYRFIGIDNAPAMIDKAVNKARMYSKNDQVVFQLGDITTAETPKADVILCNYTMQFIRPLLRPDFASRLYNSLRQGGLLFVSEKVICDHKRLNRTFIDMYHDFKRRQGYSELEIAAKREALENVLIPFSVPENIELLHNAGFAQVETYFRWINFVSFIAVKGAN